MSSNDSIKIFFWFGMKGLNERLKNRDDESTIKILSRGLLFWLFSVIIIYILKQIFGIRSIEPTSQYPFVGKPALIVLMYICIACFLEEVIYRLYLSFKKHHIALSVAAFVFSFGNHGHSILFSTNELEIIYAAVKGAIAFFIIYSIIIVIRHWNKNSIRSQEIGISAKVIGSSLICALAHLSNYTPLTYSLIEEYTFSLLPLFVIGCVCAYYRLKIDFIAGFCAHFVYDIIAFLPLIHYMGK